MQLRKFLLLSAAGFAISALLGATQVKANPNGVPVTTVPLECKTSGGNWLVSATTGSNQEFPVSVPCTLTQNLGKSCALYSYTVQSLAKLGTDHVAFSVSADQDLDFAGPSATVNPPGANDSAINGFLSKALHEYTVRVNPTPNLPAKISVVGPSNARIGTVLVKKGSTFESCLIAGPGVEGLRQPVAANECVLIDPIALVSMQIKRNGIGCANGVVKVFTHSTNCTGTGQNVTGATVPGYIFSGDPRGNQLCGEFAKHTKNSPSRFTYESGGLVYEFCYDDETGDILNCP